MQCDHIASASAGGGVDSRDGMQRRMLGMADDGRLIYQRLYRGCTRASSSGSAASTTSGLTSSGARLRTASISCGTGS